MKKVRNLKSFFNHYESAFNARQVLKIAKMFAESFIITTSRDYLAIKNNSRVFYSILKGIVKRYKNIGVTSLRLATLTEIDLDPNHKLAKIKWALVGAKEKALVSFEVSYLLRVSKNPLAIVLLMPEDEERQLRKKRLFLR
jgi:hypothetical protein